MFFILCQKSIQKNLHLQNLEKKFLQAMSNYYIQISKTFGGKKSVDLDEVARASDKRDTVRC